MPRAFIIRVLGLFFILGLAGASVASCAGTPAVKGTPSQWREGDLNSRVIGC